MGLSVLLALACGDPPPPSPDGSTGEDGGPARIDGGRDELPASTVEVDTGITPQVGSLPPMVEGGTDRPTARLEEGESGADFVLGEVVVATADRAALEAAIAPFGGSIAATTEVPEGIDGIDPIHLVTFPLDGADASRLVEDLTRLSPDARGDLRVSSDQGVATLAVVARLAASGLRASAQLIAEGAGFGDRSFVEGEGTALPASVPMSFVGGRYSRNPYDWPHLRRGGAMDHGVTEAWRVLALTDRLENRVDVAVIDGGFASGHGLPATALTLSGTPLAFPPVGVPNTMKCGGSPCPWHGTHVSQVVAANLDDLVGTVGTGAPVVDLIQVSTFGDMFTMISAYLVASAAGAEIITASVGVPVPALLSWSVLPFQGITQMLSDTGHLLFACAGNDGRDVDAEDCFLGICWEETWVYPCENDGVHCVGGTQWGSRDRHPSSAHGGEQVRMYAPYSMFTGSDPDLGEDDLVRFGSGTSYSTPYVAGVAALVWAASPSASPGDVWNTLVATAHPGSVVNAYGAVRHAVGDPNLPPSVRIVAPTAGSSWSYGGLGVRLGADVADTEDATDALSIVWSTPEEGMIGTGTDVTVSFPSPGPRTITLRVRDTGGRETVATVSIVLTNSPPSPSIAAPAAGASVYAGIPFAMSGSAIDVNDALSGMPCSALRWSIEEDPAATATGCSGSLTTTVRGTVHVALAATDAHGATGRARTAITVVDPPATSSPYVTILAPAGGTDLDARFTQDLRATATDPDGGSIVSYTWTVRSPSGEFTERNIGSGATLTWRPADVVPMRCGSGRMTIVRCTATDSMGHTGSSEVAVTYFFGPC